MKLIKKYLSIFLPPIILEIIRYFKGGQVKFKGCFSDWETALKKADGYDGDQILESVCFATKQVISGNAKSERDSIVYSETPYPFPLITFLLNAAIENNNRLNVLDFGGALGSSYYQCRDFLRNIDSINWRIVEQSNFVSVGIKEFQHGPISFYNSIEEATKNYKPHIIIVSGVIQYIANPLNLIDSLISTGADYIFIDRTPFSINHKEVISTQLVPSSIVKSCYPVWLFNEDNFKLSLLKNYDEIATFQAVDGVIGIGSLKAVFKGFLFKKII